MLYARVDVCVLIQVAKVNADTSVDAVTEAIRKALDAPPVASPPAPPAKKKSWFW